MRVFTVSANEGSPYSFDTYQCKGVTLSESLQLTRASRSINSSTKSVFPHAAAKCNGVCRFHFLVLELVPCLKSNSITALLLVLIAHWRGRFVSISSLSTCLFTSIPWRYAVKNKVCVTWRVTSLLNNKQTTTTTNRKQTNNKNNNRQTNNNKNKKNTATIVKVSF